jgi:hypothetical protein
LAPRAVNLCPGQAAAISIDEDVERRRRATAIEIGARHVHLGDNPSLPCGNDEVVGRKVVKGVQLGFEILRVDTGCPRIV